ncbi:hypothetical protein ACSBR1_038032 [Camellia fascicularis]
MGADGFIAVTSLRELFRRCSRLLNVLDLEGTLLETIPDEVFKLIHLRYLGLRDTKVKMVPKLIRKLENLDTLDLAGTYVTELPDEILYLQKLHNLISYHLKLSVYFEFKDYSGFKAPSQIGSLRSLQVLWMIEIDQRSEGGVSIVKELGRLTQLRELGIGDLRREDGVTLCSSIEKLNNLRVLYIISTKENEVLDLQSVSPVPPFLQQLLLNGRLEKFPHWIPSLHGLVTLNLGLKGLRWVRVDEGAMPHLENLVIRNSELIEEVPLGIEHLTHLQTFELSDMSEKLISKLNREVQDGDYWKIVHIPQVRIWYSEPDQSEVKFLWGSVLRMTPRGQGTFEMSAETF